MNQVRARRSLLTALLLSMAPALAAGGMGVEGICEFPDPPAESRLSPESAQQLLATAGYLANLGFGFLDSGEYDHAAQRLRDAFNILIQHPEPEPLQMAHLANNLGYAHARLVEFESAEPAYQLALDYLPEHDPELRRYRPAVLLNLSSLYMDMADMPAARHAIREARRIQDQESANPATRSTTSLRLAEIELLSGNPVAAERELQDALREREAYFGPRNATLEPVLSLLRDAYHLQGRDVEAQAVEVRIRELESAGN